MSTCNGPSVIVSGRNVTGVLSEMVTESPRGRVPTGQSAFTAVPAAFPFARLRERNWAPLLMPALLPPSPSSRPPPPSPPPRSCLPSGTSPTNAQQALSDRGVLGALGCGPVCVLQEVERHVSTRPRLPVPFGTTLSVFGHRQGSSWGHGQPRLSHVPSQVLRLPARSL